MLEISVNYYILQFLLLIENTILGDSTSLIVPTTQVGVVLYYGLDASILIISIKLNMVYSFVVENIIISDTIMV